MKGAKQHNKRELMAIRRTIESVFSVLKYYGIENILARSVDGFQQTVEIIVLTYNISYIQRDMDSASSSSTTRILISYISSFSKSIISSFFFLTLPKTQRHYILEKSSLILKGLCAFKRRIAVFEEVKDKLAELGIDYQLVEHAPALTTEQADEFIEGIPGVRTKTLFLTNKKKRNFYLVIMDDAKRLNMDKFKEIAGEKQIKMASEKSLFEKMGLPSRVVSPFGLLNNADHDIQVYFDKEIVDEDFHPNNNEKTIFIKTEDLFKFLKNLGYEALTR